VVRYLRKNHRTGVIGFLNIAGPAASEALVSSIQNRYAKTPATWRVPSLDWMGGLSSRWLQGERTR
jgi:hypothetical protein